MINHSTHIAHKTYSISFSFIALLLRTILIMDELISIIQQRRTQLNITISPTLQKHKSQLIQHQRKRIQRENWILRLVKTIKNPVLEQKMVILETIIKLMNFFQSIPAQIDNIQHVNFTETIINLFVEFYNKFQSMDLTHIRTIIRPNNGFIIVDLIKSVIDLSRKQFKSFIQEHFKEIPPKKLQCKPTLKAKVNKHVKLVTKLYIQADQESNHQEQDECRVQRQIQTSLFQNYNKAIDNFNISAAQQRFNSLYFELFEMNQKNAHFIQKFTESCFGLKKHINYDATGLYTVQEIKSIQKQRQERATTRIADLKELKQSCTGEQLKEYFKMKVQLHESRNNVPCFRKGQVIRSWFPIACIKTGDKLHPFTVMVEVNGNHYFENQFQQKYNKKLKMFLKELLIEEFSNKPLLISEGQEMMNFNKKAYLGYTIQRFSDQLMKDTVKDSPKMYKRDYQNEKEKAKQKQKILPPISSSSSSVDLSLQHRTKNSKSDMKLPSTSLTMFTKNGAVLKQYLEKRLNYSSFVKDLEVSNRKINSVIGNILKSKQQQFK